MQFKIISLISICLFIINLRAMNPQDEFDYVDGVLEHGYPELWLSPEIEEALGVEVIPMADIGIEYESNKDTQTENLVHTGLNLQELLNFSPQTILNCDTQENRKENNQKRTRKRKASAKKTEEKNEKNSLRLCKKCLKKFPLSIFYRHVKEAHSNYFECLKCNTIHENAQKAKNCCVSYMCRFCKEHFYDVLSFQIHSKNRSCEKIC